MGAIMLEYEVALHPFVSSGMSRALWAVQLCVEGRRCIVPVLQAYLLVALV